MNYILHYLQNDKQMRLRKVDEEERKKLQSSKNAEKMVSSAGNFKFCG